jgi:hypothetical protein
MATIVLYRWRVRDSVTDRIRVTRYLATEENIRQVHPDAELVPGSREERQVTDGTLTAGHVQVGPQMNRANRDR